MTIVLDTNVLVSALIDSESSSGKVVEAILRRRLRCAVSREILEEYFEVVKRPELKLKGRAKGKVMAFLRYHSELVESGGPKVHLPDAADQIFLQAALLAKAEYLVTGNGRDFPAVACKPVKVIGSAELVSFLSLTI